MVEVFDDDLAESVADAAIVLTPVNHVLLGVGRVGPEQVAEETAVGDVGRA